MKDLIQRAVTSVKAAGEGFVEGMANFRSVDRGGDLVLPSAFKSSLELFLKNPLFMLGHNISGDPVGGLPIGSVREATITEDGLKFKAEFADTPVAKMVHSLFKDNHLKAFSIGFIERDARDPKPEEVKEYGSDLKKVITDLELVEISAVPAPMNRESLAMAVKSLKDGGAITDFSPVAHDLAFAEAAKKAVDDILKNFNRKAVSDDAGNLTDAVLTAYEAWVPSLKMVTEGIAALKAVREDGEAEDGDLLASAEAIAEGMAASSEAVPAFATALEVIIKGLGGEEEDDDDENNDDDNNDDDGNDDNNDDGDESTASFTDEDLKTLTASVGDLTKEAERVLTN